MLKKIFLLTALLIFIQVSALAQDKPSMRTGKNCKLHTTPELEDVSSSDYVYIFSYEGGCKNGLAHGAGRAVWQMKGENKRYIWQGNFLDGMYVGKNSYVKGYYLSSLDIHFDLGTVPGSNGAVLLSDSEYIDELPPQICTRKLSLVPPKGFPLHDDALTKQLFESAFLHYKSVCPDVARELNRPPSERITMEIRGDISSAKNSYNRRVFTPFPHSVTAGADMAEFSVKNYDNNISRERRNTDNALRYQQRREAIVKNTREFVTKHGAQHWHEPESISRNPFAYANQTIVTAGQLQSALSGTIGIVIGVGQDRYSSGYGSNMFWIEDPLVSQWRNGSKLLVVRVEGKSSPTKAYDRELTKLKIIASLDCERSDCSDKLLDESGRRMANGNKF